MNKTIKTTIHVTLTMGAIVGLVGCGEVASEDVAGEEGAGLSYSNGLPFINGLSATNGLSGVNGLSSVNGLSATNGLSSVNGLSATNGLMTSNMGRRTVSYLARCALSSGQTLVKADANGVNYTYPGAMGLAPDWYSGGASTAQQELVSACMMAHINSAGVHVPIWMVSGSSQIGWGASSSYPNMEGTFFGNIMTVSNGKVPAFYCEGTGFTKGVVPGRLGASQANMPYTNPWGTGALCNDKCTKHSTDGYTACNGYNNPITVWRASSYTPVFDNAYKYKLLSSSSGLRLAIANQATTDGAAAIQATDVGGATQQFQFVQVATSQWEIINVLSGRALANRSGSTVTQETYNGTATDRWSIDDHNGHFKIVNKSTGLALKSPGSSNNATVGTATYSGASNTDWDVFAMDSSP